LLTTLHAVQDELGYLPAEALERIAARFNLSRAEIHGVVSFYPDFRVSPAGRHRLQICRAEACQSVGGAALEDSARELLGVDYGETSEDGLVTLEPVYCLGNCACSPSVRIDDSVYGRVDTGRLAELVKGLRGEGARS
jgi:formate dehydrogenase subunit gamma